MSFLDQVLLRNQTVSHSVEICGDTIWFCYGKIVPLCELPPGPHRKIREEIAPMIRQLIGDEKGLERLHGILLKRIKRKVEDVVFREKNKLSVEEQVIYSLTRPQHLPHYYGKCTDEKARAYLKACPRSIVFLMREACPFVIEYLIADQELHPVAWNYIFSVKFRGEIEHYSFVARLGVGWAFKAPKQDLNGICKWFESFAALHHSFVSYLNRKRK